MTRGPEGDGARPGLREGRYRLLYVSPERLVGDGGDAFSDRLSSQPDQLHRRRRSALHQPLGPRLPPRVPAARARCAQRFPAPASTPSPPPPPAACGATSSRSSACAIRSSSSARSTGRTWSTASCRARISSGRLLDSSSAIAARPASSTARRGKEVDALAAWLRDAGLPRACRTTPAWTDDERHRNQDAFLNEDVDIIVATVAFGMGIDRSDVRFVVHAGAPQSLEHYQQESGRAGRDGLEAECVLISSAADFLKWRVMLERNGELSDERRSLMRDMERYAARVGCRHRHIVGYFGEALRTRRVRGLRLLSGRARGRAGAGRRWRARFSRASRGSASALAPRT